MILACSLASLQASSKIFFSKVLNEIFFSFTIALAIQFFLYVIFSQINNKIKLYDWEGQSLLFFAIANDNYTLTFKINAYLLLLLKCVLELIKFKMFDYIREYIRVSKSEDESDKTSKKAEELYAYLHNNREGLLPYYKRGIKLPEPVEGIIYKNMGIQETQNCTLITLRMKHRRMRWSESGADNLAKLLCRKENKDLIETVCRYSGELIFDESQSEIKEPLSASKSPSRDGKGLPYMEVGKGSLPLTGTPLTAGRKALRNFILGN